jgi:hypothetical protein
MNIFFIAVSRYDTYFMREVKYRIYISKQNLNCDRIVVHFLSCWCFLIIKFCRPEGRHFAFQCFGSGSVIILSGSGFLHQQAKKIIETLISAVSNFFMIFYLED